MRCISSVENTLGMHIMNARQLERLISKWGPRSSPDLDVRSRRLRGAGRLPAGGRGPHAPDLNDAQIAAVLIAAGGTRKAVAAATAVKAYAGLVPVGGNNASFAQAPTFLDAITAAVSDRKAARSIERVMIWHIPSEGAAFQRRIPCADIDWKDGENRRTATYLPPAISKEVHGTRVPRWGSMMHDCTIIGPGLLHQLVIEREDPENGLFAENATGVFLG
jgi:hypothetical protein